MAKDHFAFYSYPPKETDHLMLSFGYCNRILLGIKMIILSLLSLNIILVVCDANDDVNPKTAISLTALTGFLVKYAEENFSVLKIFFKDPYYTIIQKDEAITLTTFIANAGGILGLCLGLSFVSIFEVIYHLVNYCASKYSQYKTQNKST